MLAETLQHADGEGVGLFPRGAPRHPDPQRRVRGSRLEEAGQDLAFERLEGVGISEKSRHLDEQVVVEGVQFLRMGPQIRGIRPERVELA